MKLILKVAAGVFIGGICLFALFTFLAFKGLESGRRTTQSKLEETSAKLEPEAAEGQRQHRETVLQ